MHLLLGVGATVCLPAGVVMHMYMYMYMSCVLH